MPDKHSAVNCQWATPTMLVDAPVWYLAEQFPWTCLRDGVPRPLTRTEPCEQCPRWERGEHRPHALADAPPTPD